ncbi:MAG: hypothetical protein K6A90_14145 [Lachnospiraceae bacterium]|nr:hypothetical protein [Lachnospiraceae bacterium]
MDGSITDISVLLVFFTRHEQFKKVFEAVREARPARLFLFQDGARADHPEDRENILKCRGIAESVDWDCEIHKNYMDRNLGPDEAGYRADRWAFSLTDKCIVLEDDVLPSPTFFPFCKEMLDKYEEDPRVMLISGFNPTEKTKGVNEDILFTSATFTWGWASWKRVVDSWDEEYSWLDSNASLSKVQEYINDHGVMENLINVCKKHRASGIPHFETILISNQYLGNGLTLTPRVNMISNIGVTAGASHYQDDISLIPKGYRRIFTMGRYDLDPENIVCPDDVTDYRPYREEAYRIYGWGHPFVKFWRFLEGSFYEIRAGNFGFVWKDFKEKVGNVVHRLNT